MKRRTFIGAIGAALAACWAKPTEAEYSCRRLGIEAMTMMPKPVFAVTSSTDVITSIDVELVSLTCGKAFLVTWVFGPRETGVLSANVYSDVDAMALLDNIGSRSWKEPGKPAGLSKGDYRAMVKKVWG